VTETQTVILPIPGLRGGVKVRASFERSTPFTDGLRRVAESGDFTGAMAEGPKIVRMGKGGYYDQIKARAWRTPEGFIRPWVEPAYTGGRLPMDAQVREGVIWNAALGSGPGGDEQIGKDYFEVSIDDQPVKAASTALGNQLPVPPSVSYAAFVTGGIGLGTLPMKRSAIPAKPSKRKAPKKAKERYAMYWFLKLAYGYTMSDDEASEGLYTPPKRIGYNPIMAQALIANLSNWIRRKAEGGA